MICRILVCHILFRASTSAAAAGPPRVSGSVAPRGRRPGYGQRGRACAVRRLSRTERRTASSVRRCPTESSGRIASRTCLHSTAGHSRNPSQRRRGQPRGPHRHGAGERAAAYYVGMVQVLQAAPAHAARRAVARVLELHDVAALLQRRVQRLHAEALRARAGRLQRAHRLQQLRPARAVTASPRKCILQPALKRVAVAGRRPGCTLCRPPWRHGQLRLPCTPPGAWLAPDIKLCGGKQQWTFVARAAAVGAVLHCEALDSAQHTAR